MSGPRSAMHREPNRQASPESATPPGCAFMADCPPQIEDVAAVQQSVFLTGAP